VKLRTANQRAGGREYDRVKNSNSITAERPNNVDLAQGNPDFAQGLRSLIETRYQHHNSGREEGLVPAVRRLPSCE